MSKRITLTERHVLALEVLVSQCVGTGAAIPVDGGEYVRGYELQDLHRRLRDHIDPVELAEVAITVQDTP